MGDIFGMIKFQIYLGCSVDAGLEPTYEETIRVTPPPPPPGEKKLLNHRAWLQTKKIDYLKWTIHNGVAS